MRGLWLYFWEANKVGLSWTLATFIAIIAFELVFFGNFSEAVAIGVILLATGVYGGFMEEGKVLDWDKMTLAMPIGRKTILRFKYILYYLFVAVAFLLIVGQSAVRLWLNPASTTPMDILSALMLWLNISLMASVSYFPVEFYFYKKVNNLMAGILSGAVGGAIVGGGAPMLAHFFGLSILTIQVIFFCLSLVLIIISYFISLALFKKRDF